MKRLVLSSILALLMLCTAGIAFAKENPLKQLTGAVWMASSEDNKQALIYGVECAISIEYEVEEHLAKKAGKSTERESIIANLNPFAKNWIRAFEHTERGAIVNEIDAWYTSHSDQQNIPVFKVLWKEIITPKLTAR